MRRFLVVVEVTDSGEPHENGITYTIRHDAQAGRWLKQHVKVEEPNTVGISVRLTEELLP